MADSKGVTVAVGADHGGFALKEQLREFLEQGGYRVTDCGTHGTDAVDYPVFARAVAQAVSDGAADYGVVVDGAGIGSCMVANKVPGVRAALCYDVSTARNAREHNNANVLTLGAGLIGAALAQQILETFLTHRCIAERHRRRVGMIDQLDRGRVPDASPQRAPEATTQEGDDVDLSQEDLTRIAARVQQWAGTQGRTPEAVPSGQTCATDMVCRCGVCVEKDPETIRRFMDLGVARLAYHEGTGAECVPEDIARCIDHTVLKPDATDDDLKKLCAEAREFRFASVCVSPSYVPLAARELDGSPVLVCTVVGFPSGAHVPEIKAMEARRAIRDGAKEIDMVINIGALKSGRDEDVYRDIRAVVEACEDGGAVSKVIIEAALLTDGEKVRACELAKRARADYVKTSTGFGPGGATVEDVALMSATVRGAGMGVKAAGGIKSYEDARRMVSAGATRLGASAGIKITQQAKAVTVSN